MYQESRIIFFYTETSFHPGSGDSIVGVDLPIQRERHTGFPKNQGGGVKGALRDMMKCFLKENGEDNSIVEEIFGPETNSAQLHQGASSPTEMRILLFPVKSAHGNADFIVSGKIAQRRFRMDHLSFCSRQIPKRSEAAQ